MNSQEPSLRELKARAQRLQPVVRVGRAGVNPPLIAALQQALDDHGLVKVRLEAFKEAKKQLFAELQTATGARPVLTVGHTITLWRAREAKSGDAPNA